MIILPQCNVLEVRVPNDKAAKIERFRKSLAQYCGKQSIFDSAIKLGMSHIGKRAGETQDWVRIAVGKEQIASIILRGYVNHSRSFVNSKTEIAIEDKFAQFKYTRLGKDGPEEVNEQDLCVRVVIRESSPKHLVVTVYPDREGQIDKATTPKVPYEVWD